MQISDRSVLLFKKIKRRFMSKTHVPPRRRSWRSLSNNEIWLRVFCQVVEVGRADRSKLLNESWELQQQIAYTALLRTTPTERRRRIHATLRQIKARYSSASISSCRKTAALVANFQTLRQYPGGPKGFVHAIAGIHGPRAAVLRVDLVTKHLAYVKNKGARDLLTTGLRIADEYLAFDIRWQNVLHRLGVAVPKGVLNNPVRYSQLEEALMKRVAEPLGLSGKELDQLVFQNYEKILDRHRST